MEALRFIFSNFWIFCGVCILAVIAFEGLEGIILAITCPCRPSDMQWTPYDEDHKPTHDGFYLVCISSRVTTEDDMRIMRSWYCESSKSFTDYPGVITAWMPLPKPYIGKEQL